MYFRRKLIGLILLAALGAFPGARMVMAQGLARALAGTAAPNKPAAAAADPLGRMTPRSAMVNFLGACHRGTLPIAAQYLDLRRIPRTERAKQGPELARTLCIVINRDAQFELNHLSDAPEGTLDDGLATNEDLLDAFHVNGGTVPLYLEREDQDGKEIWLLSPDSVARLPQLSALTKKTAFEKWLPTPLVNRRFIGTSLWVWIALIVIAIILAVVSRALSKVLLGLVKPIATRSAKSLRIHRLEAFTEPLRLLLSLAAFRIALAFLPTSALLRQYLLYLITLLVAIGVASIIMRIADVISDHILSRLDPKERALSYSVFRVSVRFVKICIFCFAVLFLLHQWGYKIDTILAGLGVGGLAIALAAQKTIENLFGGISVISDRPVLVGDFCQFGGQVGTVEDIGLRSTRIRTLDRTVVTIPNAQFSTMTLENFSKRDRMWFHPALQLRRDTKPAQIREMMNAIVEILNEHPLVDASGVPLRFTKILDSAFTLEIFAYVKTSDYNKFLTTQSELLLKILETAEELNVGFAVPFYEAINVEQAQQQEGKSFVPRVEAGENGSAGEERGSRKEETVSE